MAWFPYPFPGIVEDESTPIVRLASYLIWLKILKEEFVFKKHKNICIVCKKYFSKLDLHIEIDGKWKSHLFCFQKLLHNVQTENLEEIIK